jgi:uncharacterized protein (DUF433 family)
MSIESRGPNHVLVLERTAVPVNLIADQVSCRVSIERIMQRFPITESEIFECIETWCDIRDASENDFIKFDVEFSNGDLNVMTMGISDWIYLSLVSQGKIYHPNTSDLQELFKLGIEQIIVDCLMDLRDGNTNFEMSELHDMIWAEFSRQYQEKLDVDKIQELLYSLGVTYNKEEYE